MSHSIKGDDVNDVLNIVGKNPNVDIKKVSEARELLRVLRAQGISQRGYNLIPPFRRQMHEMHVESNHGEAEG